VTLDELGVDQPLATLTADQVTAGHRRVGRLGAGDLEPTPGHRPLLLRFCRRHRWLVDDLTIDLERRPEPADRTKALPWLR
jgi:hypothetical protein